MGAQGSDGLELYLLSGSPYGWRAQLSLEYKGLDYTAKFLSASDGETQSEAFLALNPRGKVPTLQDGATIVYESLAVMAYLERQVPDPPLFGETAAETGHIWQRLCEFENYSNGSLSSIILPLYFGTYEARADEIRAALPKVRKELDTLENTLARGTWLVGEALSAADFGVYPFIKSVERAAGKEGADGFDLRLRPVVDYYPALAAWMQRIEALPYFERTYPPHWRG